MLMGEGGREGGREGGGREEKEGRVFFLREGWGKFE